MHLLHGPQDRLAIREVKARMVDSIQVVAPQGLLQVATKLTAGAG
jgi:hypothetical protein